MHCLHNAIFRFTARRVEAGGDYAWKVKGNQPTLENDIARVFVPDPPALPGFSNPKKDFCVTHDTTMRHGRIETPGGTLTTSSLLKGHSNWPYLEQVFKYETDVTEKKTGERTQKVWYGVTTLRALPRRLIPSAYFILCAAIGASKMNFTIDAMCCWMKIIVDYVYPSWFMYLPY